MQQRIPQFPLQSGQIPRFLTLLLGETGLMRTFIAFVAGIPTRIPFIARIATPHRHALFLPLGAN
jgi:hypothetical protein